MTGEYQQNKLIKVNLKEFRQLDDQIYYFRQSELIKLVEFCANVGHCG